MKKFKIYLDTSFISHLRQDDALEKTQETLRVWEDIKSQKYDVFISEIIFEEILKCKQPKQDIMLQFLNEIEVTEIKVNDEIEELAQTIIEAGILTQKSFDDCIHIATAVVNNCDYIVSWNFKHMVNVKTNRGVRLITLNQGYKEISLIPPTMLLETEE